MSIFHEIKQAVKPALKRVDVETVSALRAGIAAIQEKATSQAERDNPADELTIKALRAYCKKLQKAVDIYNTRGTASPELANEYLFEITLLEGFLPKEISTPGLQEAVQAAVDELGASGKPTMTGRVTGHVMKQGKGFNGAEVAALAAKLCNQ